MDDAMREQVLQRCRDILGPNIDADEPVGDALLDKITALRDIPVEKRDRDLNTYILGQNFMEDNVNIPAMM